MGWGCGCLLTDLRVAALLGDRHRSEGVANIGEAEGPVVGGIAERGHCHCGGCFRRAGVRRGLYDRPGAVSAGRVGAGDVEDNPGGGGGAGRGDRHGSRGAVCSLVGVEQPDFTLVCAGTGQYGLELRPGGDTTAGEGDGGASVRGGGDGGDHEPPVRRLKAPGRAAVGAVVEAVDSEVDDGERHLTNLDNHEIIRHESSKP